MPLAVQFQALCNECVSILAELGEEFAHLGWGPYDLEECGWPFTSTSRNSTDAEEAVDKQGLWC